MFVKRLKEEVRKILAAGEVVENPSSCVKELVENSLDAGAEKIHIFFRGGGIDEIRVTDDGEGIHPEDLPLVIERYTTSKIEDVDDIFSLNTYGFRGEALHAIASVSRLEIVSGFRGMKEGRMLISEGGHVKEIKPAPFIQGTQVKVKDLFFNVPVRRKFMRSQSRESAEIMEVLRRVFIPAVHVELKVYSEKGELLRLPSGSGVMERFIQSTGIEDNFLKFEWGGRDMRIWGWITPPESFVRTSRRLYTYINKRWVRNEILMGAIIEAFPSVQRGLYPAGVIFLEIPPHSLDLNIHPRKETVRFSNPSGIFEMVKRSIMSSLRVESETIHRNYFYYEEKERERLQKEFFQSQESYSIPVEEERGRFIGIAFEKFGIVELDNELYFLDIHASEERLIFNELQKNLQEKKSRKYPLLIPQPFSIPSSLGEEFEEVLKILEKMSFEIEKIGPHNYAVRAVPEILKDADAGEIIRGILDSLAERKNKLEELEIKICSLIACHSAVRGRIRLKGEDVVKLLKRILSEEKYCPHGRPLFFKFSKKEIEGRLGRS